MNIFIRKLREINKKSLTSNRRVNHSISTIHSSSTLVNFSCIYCIKLCWKNKLIIRHGKWTLETNYFYRPHPKDGEGNVFSLSTLGGGGQVQPAGGGGGQVSQPTGGGSGPAGGEGCQVQPVGGEGVRSVSRWGGFRSSRQGGGGSGPAGGRGGSVSQRGGGGGSASCALLRVVCLLRSRRRTFLLHDNCK